MQISIEVELCLCPLRFGFPPGKIGAILVKGELMKYGNKNQKIGASQRN